jgi:hypothetical protein
MSDTRQQWRADWEEMNAANTVMMRAYIVQVEAQHHLAAAPAGRQPFTALNKLDASHESYLESRKTWESTVRDFYEAFR